MTDETERGEDLGRRLRSAVATLPVRPGPVEPLRAAGQRRHRRQVTGSIAAVLLVVAGVGSGAVIGLRGSSSPTTVASRPGAVVTTVPWIDHRARRPAQLQPAPGVPPPADRDCRPADVSLTGVPAAFPSEAGPQGVALTLRATNIGGRPCELTGEVSAITEATSGRRLARAAESDFVKYGEQPALAAGATATTRLNWSSYCGRRTTRWSWAVQIGRNPKSSSYAPVATSQNVRTPPCGNARISNADNVGGGIWTVLNDFGQPLQAPAEALVAQIDQSRLATVTGGTAAFTVTVRNPSSGPIELPRAPCPTYTVGITDPGGIDTAVDGFPLLNCARLPPTLGAGQLIRLRLRVRVPNTGDYLPGRYRLDWGVNAWGLATTTVPLRINGS
jgi:hypothetical protein